MNEDSIRVAEDEETMDLSLSNRLIRGTDRPTAVDRGDWFRIYKSWVRWKTAPLVPQ